jgi:hypothetical protein
MTTTLSMVLTVMVVTNSAAPDITTITGMDLLATEVMEGRDGMETVNLGVTIMGFGKEITQTLPSLKMMCFNEINCFYNLT